jgi:hypothetical protein
MFVDDWTADSHINECGKFRAVDREFAATGMLTVQVGSFTDG